MLRRLRQIVLVASILWIAWLLMMLIHECGHVLGAIATGGVVRQFVWYPSVLSRTDVFPNPHLLIEIWAGPIFGSAAPLILAVISQAFRLRIAYLFWAIAGFCLIANGAYIGIGSIHPVGDAKELITHDVPRWILAAFGLIATVGGILIWNWISPRFGFGRTSASVNVRHAWITFFAAIIITIIGLIFGNRGA